jgi:hypothetical protein
MLIFSTHLLLGFPSGVFLSGFPTDNLHALLFPPIRATCPAFTITNSPNNTCENYKLGPSSN